MIKSITSFRGKIKAILQEQSNKLKPKSIIIFALDGIPYSLAKLAWDRAHNVKLLSVFPTTSSSAWMSSLTGRSVLDHQIVGVVYKLQPEQKELTSIFQYHGNLLTTYKRNIFSDAIEHNYKPITILGDMENINCSWRDELLRHSTIVTGYTFYQNYHYMKHTILAKKMISMLRQSIYDTLDRFSKEKPLLLWCFIDIDQYIHQHGYDSHVIDFLVLLNDFSLKLKQKGLLPICHSDHGLTFTKPDKTITSIFEKLKDQFNISIGGAGRTRWIYCSEEHESYILQILKKSLYKNVYIYRTSLVFKQQEILNKFGNILLIAKNRNFLTEKNICFEHGSLTDIERYVSFTRW